MSSTSTISSKPITLEDIQQRNPQLSRIYKSKKGEYLTFIPTGEKKGGSALGTLFEKVHSNPNKMAPRKKWLGKVGNPRGLLRNDPSTIRTRSKREINMDTICEKLSYDLFQELGQDSFEVPKSRLSLKPIRDEYTLNHPLALAWVSQGVEESLRIMSRIVEGYTNIGEATTLDGDQKVNFMEYLQKYHRPPETILTPQGTTVPIRGLIELLAVGRCLADVDLLGGAGLNAGYVWKYNGAQIVEARIVKIDPGYSFCFTHDDPQNPCENIVINTHKKLGHFAYHLKDLRDIQTSTGNYDTIVHWSSLKENQKDTFIEMLLKLSRYIQFKETLDFLFSREKEFFYSEDAKMSIDTAQALKQGMSQWIKWQFEIYDSDLGLFKRKHHEQGLLLEEKVKSIDLEQMNLQPQTLLHPSPALSPHVAPFSQSSPQPPSYQGGSPHSPYSGSFVPHVVSQTSSFLPTEEINSKEAQTHSLQTPLSSDEMGQPISSHEAFLPLASPLKDVELYPKAGVHSTFSVSQPTPPNQKNGKMDKTVSTRVKRVVPGTVEKKPSPNVASLTSSDVDGKSSSAHDSVVAEGGSSVSSASSMLPGSVKQEGLPSTLSFS